jgi:copper(I)-binding protein
MTNSPTRRTLLASLLLAPAAVATARAAATGPLSIQSPWSRATAPMQKTGVAYLTIRNDGAEADRLTDVASPVAAKVQLHESIREGDVMKMRKVSGLAVPAHGTATLAPGGYHVMLMGLEAPLKEGQSFPLTLTFEHAGKVEVEVRVMGMSAQGAGHAMPMGTKPGMGDMPMSGSGG